MRKYLLSMFIVVLTFGGASNALAQRGTYAAPAEAELNKYPIMKQGEMTPAMQAKLGLHAVELADTVTVLNYFNNTNRFVLETLVRGTIVWADQDGTLRYKADCTNRIVKASECPKCREMLADLERQVATMKEQNKELYTAVNKTLAKQNGGWFERAANWLWDLFKFLLSILFLGLLLAVIFWFLSELWNWLNGRNTPPKTPAPAPVAPAPTPVPATPTPVVAPPAPVVPVPAPTPAPAPSIVMPVRHEVVLFYEDGTRIVLPPPARS